MTKPSPASGLERRGSLGRRRAAALENVAFRDATVALTDGVILANDADLIVSANPAAFRLLGESDLVGRRFGDLLLVSGAATTQRTDEQLVRRAWLPRDSSWRGGASGLSRSKT